MHNYEVSPLQTWVVSRSHSMYYVATLEAGQYAYVAEQDYTAREDSLHCADSCLPMCYAVHSQPTCFGEREPYTGVP